MELKTKLEVDFNNPSWTTLAIGDIVVVDSFEGFRCKATITSIYPSEYVDGAFIIKLDPNFDTMEYDS